MTQWSMDVDQDVMQFFQSSLSRNSDLMVLCEVCNSIVREWDALRIGHHQRSVEQVVICVDLVFSGRNLWPYSRLLLF